VSFIQASRKREPYNDCAKKRIRLRSGYQKKLIEGVRRKSGLTWRELAGRVNLSKNYLKTDLRYARVLLSEDTYRTFCDLAGRDYNRHVVEVLNPNWGRIKGGRIGGSISKPRSVSLLVNGPSPGLAEAIGIMLGDGNSWVKPGYYYIRVSGHMEDDKDYLLDYVRPLFSKIFKVRFGMSAHKTRKELFLVKGSKDLVYTLKEYGFPPGNKISNNVCIPPWIFKSNEYLKACIRGLIDTDGSVSPITGRTYPYIWFKSSIPNLRRTFTLAMNMLGFKLAKWTGKGTPQTYLAKNLWLRSIVKKLDLITQSTG